jgi:hypothetical protein
MAAPMSCRSPYLHLFARVSEEFRKNIGLRSLASGTLAGCRQQRTRAACESRQIDVANRTRSAPSASLRLLQADSVPQAISAAKMAASPTAVSSASFGCRKSDRIFSMRRFCFVRDNCRSTTSLILQHFRAWPAPCFKPFSDHREAVPMGANTQRTAGLSHEAPSGNPPRQGLPNSSIATTGAGQ